MSQRPQPAARLQARPIIQFRGARALYLGPALGLKAHRNAVSTLAVGLDAPIRLTLCTSRSCPATFIEASIVHVPAGHKHLLEAEGVVAFLYLDPLADHFVQAGHSDALAAHRVITTEERDILCLWSLERWCKVLGMAEVERVDPRVAAVAQSMVDDPNLYPSLADAARTVALSPSRFHALFRRQLGAPFRRYRLWRRMGLAMIALASGANLTEAAHEAGFSSSAHFSHQFLRMFGLPPSALMAFDPEIRCELLSQC